MTDDIEEGAREYRRGMPRPTIEPTRLPLAMALSVTSAVLVILVAAVFLVLTST